MAHEPSLPRRPRAPVDPLIYQRLFDQGDGALVLEELLAIFAKPAVTEGGIDAVLKTYQRAGARSVVEFIVQKMNTANGVPADDEE
jgi:hypothetical protein